MTINEVLGLVISCDLFNEMKIYLSCYKKFFAILVATGTILLIRVIEYEGHLSLGDSSCPILIDELLEFAYT